MTTTFATLTISAEAFDELSAKLEAVGYGHTILKSPSQATVIDMHGIGLIRGPSSMPVDGEKNPNHPVTTAVRNQWHKIAALLVSRHGHTVLGLDDIQAVGGKSIAINDRADGLHVYLVTDEEAAALAKREGGLPE